jgi:hypothetical protein
MSTDRPVLAVLSVVNGYRRAKGINVLQFCTEMGRSRTWWHGVCERGAISSSLHDEIMAKVAVRWPERFAMPSPLRMFAAKNPDLVAQARADLTAATPPVNVRKCLCCPAQFVSEGPHNRLCPTCRQTVG